MVFLLPKLSSYRRLKWLSLIALSVTSACAGPARSPGDAAEFLDCPRAVDPPSAFAFKGETAGAVRGSMLLIGETVDHPSATFSDCSRADVSVVRAAAHDGRPVPYVGQAGLSDPFVLPAGKTLRFGGDESGNAPAVINDLYLIEVLDERGELLAAFYLGNAKDSPVTLGGRALAQLGPSSNRIQAFTLAEGSVPVNKPLRLRTTSLIYGPRGHGTAIFALPVDATGGGEQPRLVICSPEDKCGAQAAALVTATAASSKIDGSGSCVENGGTGSARDGMVRLSKCTYKVGALLPEGDYELELASNFANYFSIWLDGSASMLVEPGSGGTPTRQRLTMDAVLLVYDGERFVLELKPENVALAGRYNLTRAPGLVTHGSGRWRIARVGQRLLVWLNGKLIFAKAVRRTGREFGFGSYDGAKVENLTLRPLAAADITGYLAQTDVPGTPEPKPTATPRPSTGGKSPRMVGSCNIDSIDWRNGDYAASALSKKPFTLKDGIHRLTEKKVKPDDLMTQGLDVQGTELRFVGAVPAALDEEQRQEVIVTLTFGDFGIWHGNRPGENQPQTMYAFRVSDDCQVAPLGLIDLAPDDEVRFQDNALLRIRPTGNHFTVEGWRIQSDKLQRASSRKATQAELDGPPAVCDEAKSLAALASFAGRRGYDLLNADPCIMRKLHARLGSQREKFENYTSMGLSPLQRRGDYLVAAGCMQHYCGYRRAALSVNVKSGVVEALIVGIRENQTISETKWFTANGAPRDVLMEPIEESIGKAKALFGD